MPQLVHSQIHTSECTGTDIVQNRPSSLELSHSIVMQGTNKKIIELMAKGVN